MKLGVFTQWIEAESVEDLAERVSELGLECVVLDSWPGLRADLDDPAPEVCRRIRTAFANAGVEIAAVGGYSNLVHPDPAARQAIHRRFLGLMRLCEGIGAPMLCSEAGTWHPKNDWDWDPSNGTERAFQVLLEEVRPLVSAAVEYGITLGFEPYVMTVIHTPERAARFVEELDAGNVRLVADPAGLLSRATLDDQQAFLAEAFRYIAPHIGLVHVEDCRPDPEGHFLWLPAGQGLIDYPLFMELVVRSGYDGPLILEHLSESDLPAAREHVQHHWNLAQQTKAVYS